MAKVKEYPISYRGIKIKELHEMSENGLLTLNPEFQRSYIWKTIPGKRERLIDSLLREFDIGKIFLKQWVKLPEGKVIFDCLDGQQRLRSIFDFIEGGYKTSPKITNELEKPCIFDDLDGELQYRITNPEIDAVVVQSDDDEIISDIFLRLQEGVPLKSSEKLNAMRGFMRNAVFDISKHEFFKSTSVEEYRFAHRYLAAQIMHLEEQTVLDSLKFVDIKYENLKLMYENYKDREKEKVERLRRKIKSNLDFLKKIFGTNACVIRAKSDVIIIYLLASYLRIKYAFSEKESKLGEFIPSFIQKSEEINISQVTRSEKNAPFYDYKDWRRKGTGKVILKSRFEIILREFLKSNPDLKLKADKRLFDWGQKLAIFNLQKGKCKKCGKTIRINEAEFHHKVPWSEGGPTTVKNGEMYCPEHHPR